MNPTILFAALLLVARVSSYSVVPNADGRCKVWNDDFENKKVNCSFLNLVSVPTTVSSNLVQELDVSFNNLSTLESESFLQYSKLKSLDLSYNNISVINVLTFSNMKGLRKVNMNYNKLNYLDPNTFEHNNYLHRVLLRGNPLLLPSDASPFLVSKSLRLLDLSMCEILSINMESFSQMYKLQTLDVRYNKMQRLSLENTTTLSTIWLEGNLWECDCYFYSLLTILSKENGLESDLGSKEIVECYKDDKLRKVTVQNRNKICNDEREDRHSGSSNKTLPSNIKLNLAPNVLLEPVSPQVLMTEKSTQNQELFTTDKTNKFKLSGDDQSARSFLTFEVLATFTVLALMLAVSVFISLLVVHYVTMKYCHPQGGESSRPAYNRALSEQPLFPDHVYETIKSDETEQSH